ncbi:PDZ domain-containing protein [Rhodopirellula sp. SWK7]|uniref:PDZ domain-containing protein n=1 Tax=Rhodopirellula sp. SWK7 TaxID=595460 RepID=UPI0005C716EE|nr:PDZ domain-containing protein [Rhodopirellula sp. SWK7]
MTLRLRLLFSFAATVCVFGVVATSTHADDRFDTHTQHRSAKHVSTVQQHQYIDPNAHPASPILGIQAIQRNGFVEVQSRSYGTPASRLGLEAGDRILEINGHRIRHVSEIRRYLQDAVTYHQGQIRVLVDNVRGRMGYPGAQRFVTVRTYLNGYSHLAGHDHYPGDSQPVYTAR